ncbi:MAG: ABC transporter ATP-binding protein [Acidimicrobiia bacterium]|nr:ABC transporter ATP-binding protein [Acidimicrobiia bacterium]
MGIASVSGLRFSYGDIVALDGIDLEIPSGPVGLVGANGAGKTTFLRLLLGILSPGTGTIEVLGAPVPGGILTVRDRVGYMPEGACLPGDQTAADFVGYAAELAGLPVRAARQRASDVLTLVGLHEERFRPIAGFSTGMLQRAKLAQAIVHDPELVLLDEPTAGLDPEGREEMLELITRLHGFGINALVSSHVLIDIEQTCEWVVMLDGGRVLRSGPLTDLSVAEEASVQVLGDTADFVDGLQRAGGVVSADGDALRVVMEGGDPFDLVRDVAAATGTAIRRLGQRRITLEDVFLEGDDA